MLATVHVIWKREMKHFLRERSQVFSTILTSLLWLLVFGAGIGSMHLGRAPEGFNYQSFIFPGVIGMALLVTSIRSGVSLIRDREFGFLKGFRATPASSAAFLMGKVAGGSTAALLQGVILLILAPTLGITFGPVPGFLAMVLMVIIAAGFVGLGIIIANNVRSFEGFNLMMSLVIMPMFFTSGSLFPVHVLPGWLRVLTYLNPLTYGVELVRGVLLDQWFLELEPIDGGWYLEISPVICLGILILFTASVLVLGKVTFDRKKVDAP